MIAAVQGIQLNQQLMNKIQDEKKLTGNESFTYALDAAKELIQANKAAETETKNLTNDFITGANDDIASLLIAQEKSGILLQYTLQVRNGLLSAYKEIMNLSV
ncbi:flagellar hook-basal body complex protein FliE [Cellulosilyticum sp. ST5]|uniref:flagellar hook-basal body complex protein FliE n=1 Tax=unclassified Cellulosilyticum TaxID=2643091 RepID=UPI000F8DDEC5|nr:flagellar hook-basal body complex protein FliE [Cellulosilyticum sp. WCF-2]QEH69614.1 flagellar hook-basal body complex protein FliE [Cellulosilyticum sp. WCF-2]